MSNDRCDVEGDVASIAGRNQSAYTAGPKHTMNRAADTLCHPEPSEHLGERSCRSNKRNPRRWRILAQVGRHGLLSLGCHPAAARRASRSNASLRAMSPSAAETRVKAYGGTSKR